MPKNLGLYNNDLSVPRKKDIDALTLRVDTNENNIATAESDIESLQTDVGQVKTALSFKQETITGGASTITDDNLTADRALVSNGSGKVAVSEVTSTELGYLDGVTSNVQTQLNSKAVDSDVVHKTGDESISGEKTFIAPEKIANIEQTTTKFKTSNGGAVIIGKEAANNGTMLRFDQVDGTTRLRFCASAAKGVMIWEQPEQGAELYIDLGERGVDYHRITFPTSGYGTLAFQSSVDNKVPKSRKINGHTLSEDVNLTASDVGALPDTTIIPTKTSELDNDSGFIISAEAPVQSVNSKTGAVVLTKSDIGLSNVDNVKQYSASNPPPYPVTSVNGQTGDVTVTVDIPNNLVKYDAVTPVETVNKLNADTLEGHNAAYFATASGLSTTNTQVATNTNNISTLTSDVSTANNNISALQTAITNKLDKSGGTMTGALVAQNNADYTTAQVRNVIISTADPSGGSNGMLWIKYTP